MNFKKYTRRTFSQLACISGLLLLSLFLYACDENTNPSSPGEDAEEYTVTAVSNEYLREGPSYNWSQGSDANGLFYWAYTSKGTPYNAVRWNVPFTSAGHYVLQAYIPSLSNLVGNVNYLLMVAGGQRSLNLSQSASAGNWVALGTFYFDADGSEYVELGNTSTQTGSSIAFDAMRWTKVRDSF